MVVALVAQRTKEIVNLHLSIEASLRRSVQDAIKIGELLTAQKEALPHGDFLPWIERELPFSQRAAYNYMSVAEHQGKLANVATLTDAYRIAQTEEQVRRVEAQDRRRERIADYRETGEKPKDWTRADAREERKARAAEPKPDPVQEALAIPATDTTIPPASALRMILDYAENMLAEVNGDAGKHIVVNGLIKHFREMSIRLNQASVR